MVVYSKALAIPPMTSTCLLALAWNWSPQLEAKRDITSPLGENGDGSVEISAGCAVAHLAVGTPDSDLKRHCKLRPFTKNFCRAMVLVWWIMIDFICEENSWPICEVHPDWTIVPPRAFSLPEKENANKLMFSNRRINFSNRNQTFGVWGKACNPLMPRFFFQ